MTGAPLASALAGRYSETNEPVFITGVQALVRLPLDQLHPPVLRAIGLERKIALGPWFEPGFRGLQAMRRLRRTRWDPFGYAHVRKLERELIVEYRALVDELLARLTAANHLTAVEIARLPDLVRGYEQVKLRNVELYRSRIAALRPQLDPPLAVALSG